MAAKEVGDEVCALDIEEVQKAAAVARRSRRGSDGGQSDMTTATGGTSSAGTPSTDGGHGESVIAANLRNAASAGFSANSSMGSMFQRDPNGGKAEEYKGLKTNTEKTAFRKQ